MFCPDCGNQVERSYNFCPKCGFKLSDLTQKRAENVTISTHKSSATAEEKNQKTDQDQDPKDEQEKTVKTKGQSTSNEPEPASDGVSSQDRSDNSACQATLEREATPFVDKEDSLIASSSDGTSQPCSVAVFSLNLPPTTPKPATEEIKVHPDGSTEDSPDSVQNTANRPTDTTCAALFDNASSQAPAQTTGSVSSEPSDQTSQECDKKEDDETQNLTDGKNDTFHGHSTNNDLEPASDGASSQDRTDNSACQATLEREATPFVDREDSLIASSSEGTSQPCSLAVFSSNLPTTTSTLATEEKEVHPDGSTEESPDSVHNTANRPTDIPCAALFYNVSSQAPAQTTGSVSSEPSDQTSQECDKKEDDETQNLTDGKNDTFQGQSSSNDLEPASDGASSQDRSDNSASQATLERRATPFATKKNSPIASSSEVTTQLNFSVLEGLDSSSPATELKPEAPNISTKNSLTTVQVAANKQSENPFGQLSNSSSLQATTGETSSAVPETSEQRPEDCDNMVGQSAFEQENGEKVLFDRQNLLKRGNENHNKTKQQTIDKQNGETEDQAAREPATSHPLSKGTSQKTEVQSFKAFLCLPGMDQTPVGHQERLSVQYPAYSFRVLYILKPLVFSQAFKTESKEKTQTHLAEGHDQSPGNRVLGKYTSPIPSCPPNQACDVELGVAVAAKDFKTPSKLQAAQISSSSQDMYVYFHAVTPKDWGSDDKIYLMSGKLFGQWERGIEMSISRKIEGNRYLVEGQVLIPKNLIHERIPYKYAFMHSKHGFKTMYEAIYQKDGHEYINRCLSIRKELLTHEGEWHQYDDVIHPELKTNYWQGQFSTKEIVIQGRNLAGSVMLNTIFELLTTWDQINVDNFFVLLHQFFHTYSSPVLHDGEEKQWGLPYGIDQVKTLLKNALRKDKECFLSPLHFGVVRLLIYNKYLIEDMKEQLSSLCDLLCLTWKPQHHFKDFWKKFAQALSDKDRIAGAVEMLCKNAKEHGVEKWFLVIPLIHLLRGESEPFEPVPPNLKPQFDPWTGLKGSKGTNVYRGSSSRRNFIEILERHAYLMDIDQLLFRSWMPLLDLNELKSFAQNVQVGVLDILLYLRFSVKSGMTPSNYTAFKELASYLINRLCNRNESFDELQGECCLKIAGSLLGDISHQATDPQHCDVPLKFLDLFCLIAKRNNHTGSQSAERIHEELFWDILERMREWQKDTFRQKLLTAWTRCSVPHEIQVWEKLLSLLFHHEKHTNSWRMAFTEDFEGKLKREKPVDQIGVYSNKIKELRETCPQLCSIMEKCALEAITVICQDKSGRAVHDLLKKHDITKFGRLMSVVVLETWPKDANGHYTKEEILVFEYLLRWPMIKAVFCVAGQEARLIDRLSDEAQNIMSLASSAFKSVTQKFLSGEIQMKVLSHIFQNQQKFVDLLKLDGLCDDGRCRDDRNIKDLLKCRKDEAETIQREKELVKSLIHICEELPQHVRVNFEGLDEKLRQDIEMMNLNELMEVQTLEQTSHTAEVTYFNLCGITRQMAAELEAIKDSVIFKMCWKNQVEDLSQEQGDTEESEDLSEGGKVYTLDMVYSKIFKSCYNKYKALYEGLKSGELPLEEIDSILEDFDGRSEDLPRDLGMMCRTDPSDKKQWIEKRVHQIEQYRDLHLAMDSAQFIMAIRNSVCPKGDFHLIEELLQMTQTDFKKNGLNCMNDSFIKAKTMMTDITGDHKQCLEELSLSLEFVQWVKKELKDINELKVFTDLASIYAGENDMEVDRVACFHDAVLGYSSLLYGLNEDSDFTAFSGCLSKLWKALENDKEIPRKLRDTARHLVWLKTVRESHGSVEFSSLMLASSINEKGVYIIKAQNEKRLILETSLMLQIEDGDGENMRCSYEDLKELQNKLMLMSGRGEQNQSKVDCFVEVFDNVQRLASVFVDLYSAGNPLFKCWEAKIYCQAQSDPCISMEIQFCKTLRHIQVRGDLIEQLAALSQKMESFLEDWQNFMDKQRSDYYYLNFFTAEQLFYLCSAVTKTNVDAEIEAKALMMFSFIKPDCTTSGVWRTWKKFHDQFEPGKRMNEGIPFKSRFWHPDTDNGHFSTASVIHSTAGGPADSAVQSAGLKELEEFWIGYIENEEIFFHDLLDIRSLGCLLKMMTATEDQVEIEPEQFLLSETKDKSLRRSLPKGLYQNQPNLIICPHDDVLTSSICLYMTSEYEPLPSYDEVLLCTPTTSLEQVELFLRRCLTPGGIGQKIYAMLRADQLTYDVSCAMEKCYQKLQSLLKHDFRLVIFCSSEREHTYIPTAFSQYKRDFVPQESLEKMQKYLSRHYTVSSECKNALFKGDLSGGIVASQRAGVGKSLYVQRLYEKLEKSVQQGSALKKCIRVTEHEVNEHKVLRSLYDTPEQRDVMVFHFDITSTVQKGLKEFLFKLLFLRYLMDSEGQMWRCSHEHLYIVELLESSTNHQPSYAFKSGQKENFAVSDIFPKVNCHSPKEVMALEMRREENAGKSDEPLMDDTFFMSEVYQRPYQYLSRFHNKSNLDNFTYHGVEGTHGECLQMLLFYCGIPDPSWAEIRNFVWFLNLQLQDCENSDFCKFELVGDTLQGFKNFVVEFMILMSKDFATPSLCITDQSPGRSQIDLSSLNEQDLAPFLIRKRWESEPHPYIFFNDDHMSMTFIGFHLQLNDQRGVDAINPLTREVIKRNIMTKELFTGLKLQRVPFNQDFDQLSRADKIEHLCSVLGIKWPTDPDETYELTTDNILKMMAIHMRFRCGIPVVVMGETGCGKTRLVKFMCDLRKCAAEAENMKLVKVHGGTTSDMIHEKVREAETLARFNKENHAFHTVLFFDEANTTDAISSIKEIICDNTVEGQPLCSQTGLQVVAACNPYRKHTDKMIDRLEASGLGYRVRAEETEDRLGSIPIRQLVYRVHALPPSMIPLVWDFGQLNDSTEQVYIEQMVQRETKANLIEERGVPTITNVLSLSQKFMRERKDECSFVSLRDVERCMQVFVWFYKEHPTFAKELKEFVQKQNQRTQNKISFPPADDRVIWSLLMATGVCYQACLENKKPYLQTVSKGLPHGYNTGRILKEIQLMQDLLLSGVPVGRTIAKNEALKENVFMMVICVELRIPLFIVGKPGSSKSLSKTLVADAMQGQTSHSELYKRLKQIHLVSFQCSPHSSPEGIINTFKQCARFQENKKLDEYISVVVLDEIGLAEDSCKMPLKTLHPLLEEGCVDDEPQPHKRVGFIGISNWALDPAKMNRGIFVSRGDPDQEELIKTAKGICASNKNILSKIDVLFQPFARAYMTICKEGRGFFGLRDFYSFIKKIFSFAKDRNEKPTADEITEAVLRNFSGKDNVDVIGIFSKELRDEFANASSSTSDLVNEITSPAHHGDESRYLLILTKNYAALQILEQAFISHQIHPEIIFGSSFPRDQEYTQICRNINRVKICMETGQTVVLLNLQNLYESLYDALNQYYVTLGDQKYVDLGLGTHRVKCRVHKNFRLIVIEEKEVVYEQFPIPLINRLEKHYLDINTVLSDEQKSIVRKLQGWVDDFVFTSGQHNTKQYVPSDVFVGYHSDTCSSVVLQVTGSDRTETDAQTILDRAKGILLNCATPDSIIRLEKSRLPVEEREHLIKEYAKENMHSSLGDYIIYHKKQLEECHFFSTEVTTFSRLLTAADTHSLQKKLKLDNIHLLSLQQFDTEYSFLKKIRECLGSTTADKVLIIQRDFEEDARKRNVFSSAKYAFINEVNKWASTDNAKPLVYFITKLPRIEGGTSYIGFQGGPWRSVHIDDLRRTNKFAADVDSLQKVCISEIFEDPPEAMETEDHAQNDDPTILEEYFDVTNLIRSCVQGAVSMLRDATDNSELSTKRVENLLTLLDESQTQGLFTSILRRRIHSLLKEYETNTPNPKSWVLREASNISALQEGGTFLHTLWRKVQAVVTPLLANVVSIIDRDCNLDLLLTGCNDIKNLWLKIFESKEMLPVPYERMESNSSVTVQSHITSGSTMCCCMPFSWWIKDFMDGLMMQASRHDDHSRGQMLELFSSTPLGRYMNENVNEKMKEEFFQRYLQDFVSMTFKRGSDEELQLMRQALTSCVDEVRRQMREERELSLPLVHFAHHSFQSRLQNLSRMLAIQPDIVTPLTRNQHTKPCPEMVLDVYAAQACVEHLENLKLDTDALCKDWLRQVKRLQASLEMICSQQHSKQYGQRCNERLHLVRNGWKRIYILSLFVEHLLLNFHTNENQLRELVQKHVQTLSRVLEENSDVKSVGPFEEVIKILMSCKQGASNQIFKFGLMCGVCIREPQDPVGLPCHHIFCSACIRQSLEVGQASCPMCRQELPDDFQPHISEEIRASVKKNSDLRQRCNRFFIDLLSAVCFKENTPPTKGVINHLLSFLMVETEHRQTQTKDLSPFDESPDKNPVVRSVILKLLLKFSFEDVEEYLQQHLSYVEDSRFVVEEDKAELYALYINCLEDSLWEKMPQDGCKAKELMLFTRGETTFLDFFLSDVTPMPEKVSVQHLQYIARLRLCLTFAASLIGDHLSENDVPDGADDFLDMVVKLCENSGNDWYRVYLIRKLSERQGVEVVQTLVKQQKFSWLFPAEIHQQNQDGGQMDQYLVYGEEYKAVRDAVAKAVVDGEVEQIEEVCEGCTAPPRNRTLFILLALFREVSTLYRSANTSLHPTTERCQEFEEFIQGSSYLHQKEVRNFASALVHNTLGALTLSPEQSVTDNAVIELTIHLAAVLLTGNQPLVMPLKQLGLSPENMQRAFIPTMPDDMLAVAQTVIQQNYGRLSWYVCPNNHPCFVDECGLPMQRGECPDCGLEVGGENHKALPGFRCIQVQQDQTRRGHILGDPERRNNPDALDTKNMSLAAFTLVRLVTHLAMLLGASEKPQHFQNIIQPPVEDSCQFLRLHTLKDLEQLSQTLGGGADDTAATVHLVLRSLQELEPAGYSGTDPYLTNKASRNHWETTVAEEIMTPKLRDLDGLLQQAKESIRTDSRVSSNFIMRTTFSDDCSFLKSLAQGSQVHSSAVWSCRTRLSLPRLMHIVEQYDQKEELPLLWRFLQKEIEFRQIKHLPVILILQKVLVKKFQNASDQIVGSIRDFIEKQRGSKAWYEKHIKTFLTTWNLLRVSVKSNEMKIPEEFCSEDLNLDSDLQYLLPRRQGPGLCATGLVSYLVALQNELVNAVDNQTGEDSSCYRVGLAELTGHHVISYEVDKDLLPLVLSNCQYSLERGHETISNYDLPRIQQQILTRFLQGKPLITREGIPTLAGTQERNYETIFKTVKGKVRQDALLALTRTAVSRELESYSEVCEALRIVELLLGFLSMAGSDPMMSLVTYLQDILKMADHIDQNILQALKRCHLRHCVSLWQLLFSLKSEHMLLLKKPFSECPTEYHEALGEEDKIKLKGFLSRRNMDQWLLEMHEFLLLSLSRPRAAEDYKPEWSVKDTVAAYMERKEVEVPLYIEENFPENLQLSQIVETWKYCVTAKRELMEK
ncbi:E3 ubiquitin-protein ligase rnf213-alpha-like isoform X2 [Xyrichtys novacula]|uniref:RING-type E3 ubiquitin transferase n=1 Tax=Xyrichtys novacula TaxID=13765 RepID=A0AAV1FIT6_XYRNO|nr:E3 ubiquitin-protein ligase rnf213-alpha-like isoform X2 [Xyrichtys novacula]